MPEGNSLVVIPVVVKIVISLFSVSTTYKSKNDLQTSDAMNLGTTKGNLNYISKYVYTPPHPKIRFYSLLFVADPLYSELVSFQSHS